jgi:hypothetical protein
MIDPALSEAMAEAYASAPGVTAWDTLELTHSTFTDPARMWKPPLRLKPSALRALWQAPSQRLLKSTPLTGLHHD